MKRYLLAIGLSLSLAAGAFAGCSGGSSASTSSSSSTASSSASSASSSQESSAEESTGETKRVAVIVRLSDMYGAWLKVAYEAAAEDYANLDVAVYDNTDDAAKHLEVMQTCIEQSYDYIIVQTRQEDLTETYNQAIDAGIKMIQINGAQEWSLDVLPSVVCDEVAMGQLIAADAAEKIPENGTVAIVNGPAGIYVSDDRREGFQIGLLDARDDVTLLDEQDGGFAKDTAMNKVSDWLQVYDNIDCILCASDSEAVGAVEAYNAAGKDIGDTIIYGIDGLTEACTAIMDGSMEGSALQDATLFATTSLDMIEQDIDGEIDLTTMVGSWDEAVTSFDPVLIDESNVDEHYNYYVEQGLVDES